MWRQTSGRAAPPWLGRCLAIALVVAAALPWGSRALAQDAGDDPPSRSQLAPRVRGVATWSRYVWTLDRPLLDHITDDLEAARAAQPGPDHSRDFLLAYAHLSAGRREPGVAAIDRVRRTTASFVPLLLLDGVLAVLDGRGDDAITHFDNYLEALDANDPDPNFARELRLLGRLHRGAEQYHLGRVDEAVPDYEAAIALAEEAGRSPARQLVQRLALAYQMNDAHAKAEGLVLGLLKRDPANAFHPFNMGVLKAGQFEFEEARIWYQRALRRDPRFIDARAKLAAVCEKLDLLREMRGHLEAFSAQIGDDDVDRRAEAAAGYAAYYWRMSRRLDSEGREAERDEALARTVSACREALTLHTYCMRALQIVIKAAHSAGIPEDEVEMYRKRLDDLRQQDGDAPDAFRRTLC